MPSDPSRTDGLDEDGMDEVGSAAGAVGDSFVAATILFRIAAEDMFQLFPPAVFVVSFVETSGSRERVRDGAGASYLRLARVGNVGARNWAGTARAADDAA